MKLLVYAVLSSAGLLLIKQGLSGSASESLATAAVLLARSWRFLLGFCLYAGGFVLWLHMLRTQNLSTVFPAAAGALFALTAVLSVIVLGERITLVHLAAYACILTGILLLSWQR